MSIRNDKFWGKGPENVLWKAAQSFVEEHEITCGLSDGEQDKYAEELLQLIEKVKEPIYREVDREYLREDVCDKIEEEWDACENKVADIFPIKYLDKLVDLWQDALGGNDGYWEALWNTLRNVFGEERCHRALRTYGKEGQLLYKHYLEDWFRTHKEGEPVSIYEFMSNEMKDEESAKYYRALAKQDPEWLVMEIIERADKEGLYIEDLAESVRILLKAKERFNLDLVGLLNACSFDLWHDFLEIHKHYHAETESFDNRFLPRYARDVQKGTQNTQAAQNKPQIEMLSRRISPEDCTFQLKILAYVQGDENIVFTEEEKAKIAEMRKMEEDFQRCILGNADNGGQQV